MKRVNKTVIDLRRSPSARSERVSQALFGTPVKELQKEDEWCLIETPDSYQGFVENKHLSKPSSLTGKQWKIKEAIVPVCSLATDQVLTQLTFDTRFFAKPEGTRLILALPAAEDGYIPQETAIGAGSTADLPELERIARALIGTPYLWGGTSTFGFDCSGFIQRLFHYCFNEWLPRDTVDQRRMGKPVTLEGLEHGDLCFFPGHVALYVGDGLIIHSNRYHSGVSINQLLKPKDDYGKGLLKAFQGARRVSPKMLQP